MYLFLLGRDYKLSKLEIAIYFYKNNIKYDVILEDNKYLIIDTKQKVSFKKIQEQLAGITRIVNIYLESKEITYSFLEKIEYIKNKFNYTISSINLLKEDLEYIESLVKQKLKKEKTKAIYKKPKKHGTKKNYIANPYNYYSWKIEEGFELFIVFVNNKYYFGKTITCFNPKKNIYRDKNQPKRKELYSTSIRLADIMINYLGFEKNKVVVDPFCGTGTYLVEALIKGYDVIGVDVDKQMCKNAEENIKWAKKEYNINNKYTVIYGDSSKKTFKADYCVFEPYMGPFLRKLLPEKKAKKVAKDLEKIYFNVFKNLSKNLNKKTKIVCILPEIPMYNSSIKIKKDVFYKNGFKIKDVSKYSKNINLENPIEYNTPDGSRMQRKIYLLERK
jgi:tRNA G10  N-methylase Trm11